MLSIVPFFVTQILMDCRIHRVHRGLPITCLLSTLIIVCIAIPFQDTQVVIIS